MSATQVQVFMLCLAPGVYATFAVGFGSRIRSRLTRHAIALIAATVCALAPFIAWQLGSTVGPDYLGRSLIVALAGVCASVIAALLVADPRGTARRPGTLAEASRRLIAIPIDANGLAVASPSLTPSPPNSPPNSPPRGPVPAKSQINGASPLDLEETQRLFMALRDQSAPVDLPDDAPWLGPKEGRSAEPVDAGVRAVTPARAAHEPAAGPGSAIEPRATTESGRLIIAGGAPLPVDPTAERAGLTVTVGSDSPLGTWQLESERKARRRAEALLETSDASIRSARMTIERLTERLNTLERSEQAAQDQARRSAEQGNKAVALAREATRSRHGVVRQLQALEAAGQRDRRALVRAVEIARKAIEALRACERGAPRIDTGCSPDEPAPS